MKDDKREAISKVPKPPGGNCFDAVHLMPEGWVVLAPWIRTPDGYWWRPSFSCAGWTSKAEEWAKSMATEINKAMKEGKP
jgi:hypothetical protein